MYVLISPSLFGRSVLKSDFQGSTAHTAHPLRSIYYNSSIYSSMMCVSVSRFSIFSPLTCSDNRTGWGGGATSPKPNLAIYIRVLLLCTAVRKGVLSLGFLPPGFLCPALHSAVAMSGKRTLSLSAYKKNKEALAVAPAKKERRLGFGESVSTREVDNIISMYV